VEKLSMTIAATFIGRRDTIAAKTPRSDNLFIIPPKKKNKTKHNIRITQLLHKTLNLMPLKLRSPLQLTTNAKFHILWLGLRLSLRHGHGHGHGHGQKSKSYFL
jgi:hypothetical protein